MLGGMLRAVFGFVLASLAAGVTLVLFVYTPAELAAAAPGTLGARLTEASLLALAAAMHAAVFSASFALVAAVGGAWRGIRNVAFYVLAGLVIGGLGFLSHRWGEASALNSVSRTALSAYLLAGGVAGAVYWLCAGRRVGARPAQP